MQVRLGMNKRFIITAETNKDRIYCVRCDFTRGTSKDIYTAEDCIMNRLLLNQPLDMPLRRSRMPLEASRLFKYQITDLSKMLTHGSILNANDMGLGKTIEAIIYCKENNFNKILVVCQKTIARQWTKDFKEWYPEVEVNCLPKSIYSASRSSEVVICNYEKLLKIENFKSVVWDVVICDEVHRVKNHKSQIGQAIHQIPTLNRIGLSGTPIYNYIDDLYNILKWIDPKSVGGSYWHFANVFCNFPYNPFARTPKGLTKDKEMAEILEKLLQLYVIRNKKEDVLKDLPEFSRFDVWLDPSPTQKEVYNNVKKLLFEELPENCTIKNAATHTLRLIQVTSNPEIFSPNKKCANPKFEYILGILEDSPELKLVVFTNFKHTATALRDYLKFKGINCAVITGDVEDVARQAEFELFLKTDRVLIGTLASIGTGLDGLQKVCSTAVFIDSSWTPTMNEQAESRLHRIGQKLPVQCYYLRIVKSIDEYVGKMVESKSEDIRKVLGDL